MKKVVFLVCLLVATKTNAAVPMARVIGISDSHTIVVEADGRRSTIVLRGVDIPAGEEIAAMEYLHRLLDGAWVYAEDGNVYRSPDGLFVNAELQRHAWRSSPGMRYLGEVNLGPRSEPRVTPASIKRPSRSARVASRPRFRRPGRLR